MADQQQPAQASASQNPEAAVQETVEEELQNLDNENNESDNDASPISLIAAPAPAPPPAPPGNPAPAAQQAPPIILNIGAQQPVNQGPQVPAQLQGLGQAQIQIPLGEGVLQPKVGTFAEDNSRTEDPIILHPTATKVKFVESTQKRRAYESQVNRIGLVIKTNLNEALTELDKDKRLKNVYSVFDTVVRCLEFELILNFLFIYAPVDVYDLLKMFQLCITMVAQHFGFNPKTQKNHIVGMAYNIMVSLARTGFSKEIKNNINLIEDKRTQSLMNALINNNAQNSALPTVSRMAECAATIANHHPEQYAALASLYTNKFKNTGYALHDSCIIGFQYLNTTTYEFFQNLGSMLRFQGDRPNERRIANKTTIFKLMRSYVMQRIARFNRVASTPVAQQILTRNGSKLQNAYLANNLADYFNGLAVAHLNAFIEGVINKDIGVSAKNSNLKEVYVHIGIDENTAIATNSAANKGTDFIFKLKEVLKDDALDIGNAAGK